MKNNITKPIVLIGGVAGTGKTTIANLLLHLLNIDHKIGLGWIRETLRTLLTENEYPELFDYSFKTSKTKDSEKYYIFKQTEYHKQSIEACIDRAHREGTSLIIEGVSLVPGIINTKYVTNYFWLKMPGNIEVHKKLLLGETHMKRNIRQNDFSAIRKVGKYIEKNFNNHNVDFIEFEKQEKRTEYIISKIKSI